MTSHNPGMADAVEPPPSYRGEGFSKTQLPDVKPGDMVVAVMGVTGAGKSSFINHLTNETVVVGHGLESCTSDVAIYEANLVKEGKLYLVDTPGFDDTYRTDTAVLKDLAFWLNAAYRNEIKLTGIIYLHRISDTRMSGAGMKNLRMFKKLCGEKSLGSVVLATTMWDTEVATVAERREALLTSTKEFWGEMVDNGSRIFRHDRGPKSVVEIVNYLVNRKRPVVLEIQIDMVDHNKDLDETAAGQEVEAEIAKARKMYESKMRDLEEELKEAMLENDKEHQREIQQLKRETETKMRQGEEDLRQLRVSREQLEAQMRDMAAQHQRDLQRMDERAEAQARDHQRAMEQSQQMMLQQAEEAEERARQERRRHQRELEEQQQRSNRPAQPQYVFVPYAVDRPVYVERRQSSCNLM